LERQRFERGEKASKTKNAAEKLPFANMQTTIFSGDMGYKAVKITTFCVFLLTEQLAYAIV